MDAYTRDNENFRFEDRGCGLYSVFKDIGNAYLHDGVVRIRGKYKAEKVYEAYQEMLYSREANV